MRYGCYANGFRFNYHLANFFFFLYFQVYVLPLGVSVRVSVSLVLG